MPVYTDSVAEAATGFDLFIQGDEHAGWPDLAAGAGGDYRYIRPVSDSRTKDKITQLKLLRLDDKVEYLPAPYTGRTGDINADRGKSFLYLMWETRTM